MTSVTEDVFGVTRNSETVHRFTLKNSHDVQVQVISLGATVTSICVPNKQGKIDDVTAGFETVSEYEENPPYLGTICGRVANRIAGGKFTLDGVDYELAVNNETNHLHGGIVGFNKKLWSRVLKDDGVELTYVSPDGEEGYPGQLTTTVTYRLSNEDELSIDYTATTTKPTLVNLTNHSYFNLAGHTAADVFDHTIMINADKFTPSNDSNIPTGEVANVQGTVWDLRQPVLIGDRIHDVPGGVGYDHNFCVNKSQEKKLVARVKHEGSGRVMECFSDQPGLQLYTAHYLGPISGKGGATYRPNSHLCLETQNYPDAVHHPNFPNAVLRPGEVYRHSTGYKFSVEK